MPSVSYQLIPIDDPRDARLDHYRRLRDVQLRQMMEPEEGLFIAEGSKVIQRAFAAGLQPYSLLLSPRWLPLLAELAVPESTPIYLLEEPIIESVTGFHVHRGALAAMRRPGLPTVEEILASTRRILVLEDIVDHTNVGAMFRCAAAFSFDAVLVAPRCADPWYRRSIKVGMGAVFSIPWTRLPSWEQAVPTLTKAGFTSVALTLAQDAVPLSRLELRNAKVALLLGSEGHGLSQRWQEAATYRAIIPIAEHVDSLNVGAAAAIACYELQGTGESTVGSP